MHTLSVGTHGDGHSTPQIEQGDDSYLGAAADEARIDGGLCKLLCRHCFRGTLQHLRVSHKINLAHQAKLPDHVKALIPLMLKYVCRDAAGR